MSIIYSTYFGLPDTWLRHGTRRVYGGKMQRLVAQLEIASPLAAHFCQSGQVIAELNGYLRGWWGYFALSETRSWQPSINGWIIRRLRAYLWKQWKLPRTKVRELMRRGVSRYRAVQVGNTRKGAWRLSKNGFVKMALPNRYFTQTLGLVLLG